MSLSRRLQDAERRGVHAVRLDAQRKNGVQELSASARALHGRREAAARKPASSHTDPEQERDTVRSRHGRTGIVSVNGRDVGEMCCTGRQRV